MFHLLGCFAPWLKARLTAACTCPWMPHATCPLLPNPGRPQGAAWPLLQTALPFHRTLLIGKPGRPLSSSCRTRRCISSGASQLLLTVDWRQYLHLSVLLFPQMLFVAYFSSCYANIHKPCWSFHRQHAYACVSVRMSQLFVVIMSTSVSICVQGCILCRVQSLQTDSQRHVAPALQRPCFLFSASEPYSAGMHVLHMVRVSQVWRNKHYRRLRPCWMR